MICNIAIYTDDTLFYSKCEKASDLWQQLEFTSNLESELQDTVDWDRKWLVDFNAGKTHLSLLNWIGALTLSLLLKLCPRKLEP